MIDPYLIWGVIGYGFAFWSFRGWRKANAELEMLRLLQGIKERGGS